MPGVIRTRVGYCGGKQPNPTYKKILDYTETFQIDFDPSVISYKELAEKFWKSHNPCGGGGSTQYRSALWYHNEDQKKIAEATRDAVQKERKQKITTAVVPLADTKFYMAEDYHQKYYLRNNKDILAEFRKIYPKEDDFVNSPAAAKVNGLLDGCGTVKDFDRVKEDLGLSESALKTLATKVRGR